MTAAGYSGTPLPVREIVPDVDACGEPGKAARETVVLESPAEPGHYLVRWRARRRAKRRSCRFPGATSFEDVCSDPRVVSGLREVYGSVDEVELYPGLFAEDVRPNAVLPPLIGRMVAIDAFSQAFTNPLLAPRVFNPATFSPLGWDIVRTPQTLSDLLHRNVPGDRRHTVTMTRPDWPI